MSAPALVLLFGCAPSLGEVVAAADPALPNVIHLTWDLFAPPGDHWVEYGLDGALDQQSPRAPTSNTATLLGLKSGRSYDFRVVVETDAGERVESAVGTVEVAEAPDSLPRLVVEDADDGAMEPGGLVLTSLLQDGASWIVVVDRDGDPVWYVASDDEISVPGVHLDAAGAGVVYTQNAHARESDHSGVVHQPFDGRPRTLTVTEDAHHDAIQLPSGEIVFLREFTVPDVLLEDGTRADVADDVLAVAPEGSVDLAAADTRFSFQDDYGAPPWRMCDHFDDDTLGGGKDWIHANSVMLDPSGEALWVMSKNLDAVVAVPLEGGAPLWQIGGRFGDFVDVDGDVPDAEDPVEVDGPNGTWWSHGHMSHVWDGGFLVFDNGYHHHPPVSRVVEYALDVEARTLRKVWSFRSETDQFLPLLGDAHKLPSGNVLASWTIQGMLTEITPEGQVVWRASAELGAGTTRVVWLPDLYGVY